jgi:hypothetical protein
MNIHLADIVCPDVSIWLGQKAVRGTSVIAGFG